MPHLTNRGKFGTWPAFSVCNIQTTMLRVLNAAGRVRLDNGTFDMNIHAHCKLDWHDQAERGEVASVLRCTPRYGKGSSAAGDDLADSTPKRKPAVEASRKSSLRQDDSDRPTCCTGTELLQLSKVEPRDVASGGIAAREARNEALRQEVAERIAQLGNSEHRIRKDATEHLHRLASQPAAEKIVWIALLGALRSVDEEVRLRARLLLQHRLDNRRQIDQAITRMIASPRCRKCFGTATRNLTALTAGDKADAAYAHARIHRIMRGADQLLRFPPASVRRLIDLSNFLDRFAAD